MFDVAKPQFSLGVGLFVTSICTFAFTLASAGVYPARAFGWTAVASLLVVLPFFIFTGLSGRETFFAILLVASKLAFDLLAIAMNHVEDPDIMQSLLVALIGTGWFCLALPHAIVLSCLARYFYSRKRIEPSAVSNSTA